MLLFVCRIQSNHAKRNAGYAKHPVYETAPAAATTAFHGSLQLHANARQIAVDWQIAVESTIATLLISHKMLA